MDNTETILTITGSDGTGSSGVQADISVIHELGGVAVSVITSITAQNTLGIQEFYDLPATAVRLQTEAIVNDLQPQVVKIGLVRRIDVVQTIADVLRRYRPRYVVYAPVLESTRGERLVSDEVFEAIQRLIVPLCTVVLNPPPEGPHGSANRLSAAVAVFLSRGEQPEEALQHARQLTGSLQPMPKTEPSSRSRELYTLFTEAVERFCHRYADVAFYAEQLNVSPRYLGQVTRRIAKRSPKSIIDERITTETERMLNSSHTLKEIAALMGFSSQAHLSRFFKKQRNMSPTDYRKTKNYNH